MVLIPSLDRTVRLLGEIVRVRMKRVQIETTSIGLDWIKQSSSIKKSEITQNMYGILYYRHAVTLMRHQ